MPTNLLPLQSGVGNIANAVLFGLEEGALRGADIVYGSDSGRDDPAVEIGQADLGVGYGLFSKPRNADGSECGHEELSRAYCAAAAGDFEPPRDHSAVGRDSHERDDRGRRLWQCEFDTRDGIAYTERYWRLGRLRAEWVVDFHGSVDGAEGNHLDHCADGVRA